MAKREENKLEETKPHFDISSYVVRQLGEQLISDEVTALMELVKNSFDADADYVNIVINTEEPLSGYDIHYRNHNGYIVIDDNGDGMVKDEIEKGWLTIAVSKKRKMKQDGVTTVKGRTPLGEKGLGRLSTQKLATKMELLTNKIDSDEPAYHVYFNWNDFTEDTLLSKVNVEILPKEKAKISKGTRLILLDLKDKSAWKGDNLEKIKGRLSQLIFPKKRKRPFSVYLTIDGKPIDLDFISESIKDLAVTRYSFSFYEDKLVLLGKIKLPKLRGNDRANYLHLIEADKGRSFYNFISQRTNKKGFVAPGLNYLGENGDFIEFKKTILLEDISGKVTVKNEQGEDLFFNPGNFRGKIDEYAFAKDTVDITPLEEIFKEFSNYTTYIQSQTGIRVFRDGFGIRPFGLDGEDWLRLNQEQTSGNSFYGIRPANVMGYIQIGAKENPNLLEKTDREGIIDNAYFKNFYLINKKVVSEINLLLESIKRAYNEYRKKYGIDKTGLKNQEDVFDLMKRTGTNAGKLSDEVKSLDKETNEIYNTVKNEVRNVTKQPLFVTEEDKRLNPLLKSIEEHLEKVKSIISKLNAQLEDSTKLNEAVHLIEPQIKALQDQLAEFTELAGLGIVAESLSHEIDNILDNLFQKSKTTSKYIKEKKYNDLTLSSFMEYINGVALSLRKQVSHLSPLLKYLREEKEIISIANFANEQREFYKDRLRENQIKINVDLINDFKITINRGRLTQIFDNIILNSEYWLKEFSKSHSDELSITIKIDSGIIQISDSGMGIDPSIEDRIFQPFITAKQKKQGRGLGLFIVQQLLEASGCDIMLLPEKNGFNRRYIIQINFTNVIK